MNLTTNDNVTGQIHLVRHPGSEVVESATPAGKRLRYHTYIFDEQIVKNLSGDATIRLRYRTVEFKFTEIGTEILQFLRPGETDVGPSTADRLLGIL